MKTKSKSKWEKYAEKYLKEKGYEVKLVKQYQSKTIYEISKDGITDKIEIPSAVADPKAYMCFIDKNFDMLKELTELRKQANE